MSTKPVSERRLAANRANAMKSTGPRTADGKARSSQNALKHAFTAASFMALSLEEEQNLETLKAEAIAFYRPANSQEQFAVERIALAQTHMLRGASLEAGFFTAALNQSPACDGQPENVSLAQGLLQVAQESNAWALLLRYQGKAERDYRRAIQDFERLKVTRQEMQNEPNQATQPIEPETLVRAEDGAGGVAQLAEVGSDMPAGGFAVCPYSGKASPGLLAPQAMPRPFDARPQSSSVPRAADSHLILDTIASQLRC